MKSGPNFLIAERARAVALALGFLSICSGCVGTSARQFLHDSAGYGFDEELVGTPEFSIQIAYRPAVTALSTHQSLRVYIEGDGRAWLSKSQPSSNPTPSDAIALKLATEDISGLAVLYVARPCQFSGRQDAACNQEVWTMGRYSESVVRSIDDVISQYAAIARSESIVLIGYSGGGTIAALVAARRDDVNELVTIAAPLDHTLWTEHHGVSPLVGSLNPIDYPDHLVGIKQLHFVGDDDAVVPETIVDSYLKRLGNHQRAAKRVVEHFGHVCCWTDSWSTLQTEVEE